MDQLSAMTILPDAFRGSGGDITSHIGLVWEEMKAPLIIPVLKLMVAVCLAMSVMLFIEKVYMGVVITFIKLLSRKPKKLYKWEAMRDDVELGNSAYPLVLVQIPMYNEKEVCYFLKSKECDLMWACLLVLMFICICRFISSPLELHVGFHGHLIGS